MAQPRLILSQPRSGTHSIQRGLSMLHGVRTDGEVLHPSWRPEPHPVAAWMASVRADRVHEFAVATVHRHYVTPEMLAQLRDLEIPTLAATRRDLHALARSHHRASVTADWITPIQFDPPPREPPEEVLEEYRAVQQGLLAERGVGVLWLEDWIGDPGILAEAVEKWLRPFREGERDRLTRAAGRNFFGR